jgi:hypothetical protein
MAFGVLVLPHVIEDDLALAQPIEAGNETQLSALATTAAPDNRHELSGRNMQVYVAKNGALPKALAESAQGQRSTICPRLAELLVEIRQNSFARRLALFGC